MSKNHRGTGVRTLVLHGRGTCPMCKKTGLKLLYEQNIDGATVKVCKFCNAALKNKARAEAPKKVETAGAEATAESAAPEAEADGAAN